jgi:hypothetical protein
MKRLPRISKLRCTLAALPMLLLGACGDDGAAPPADAATAMMGDAPQVDALYDTDALPPDLNECGPTAPCAAGTDCIRVPWLSGKRLCLRGCAATADCGLDEICYHNVRNPAFMAMANHCYSSFCSQPLLPCSMGDEIGLSLADQRPGTCLPRDDEGALSPPDGGADGVTHPGPLGQCLEAGKVDGDLPCELQGRLRGGEVCAQGLVCVGGATADLGRCARLCDPLAPIDPCASSGRVCFDASQGTTVYDRQTSQILGQIHATWGYCRTGDRCALTAPGTCPTGTGCLPTTPVRGSGFCGVNGQGDVALGQGCVPFGVLAPSQSERCQEALCDSFGTDADAGIAGICRPYCDQGHACPVGSCVPYTWDEAGSLPNLTQGFGVCR